MTHVTIQIDDEQVVSALSAMQEAIGNTRPAMEAIGRKIKSQVDLGFRSGQSPWGDPWKPLKFRQGQPLRDTGRLQRSIGWKTGDNYVDVGTNVLYGPVQQYGATIRPVNHPFLVFDTPQGKVFSKEVRIPPRPFLPVDKAGNVDLPGDWAVNVLDTLASFLGLKP